MEHYKIELNDITCVLIKDKDGFFNFKKENGRAATYAARNKRPTSA